MGRRALTVAVTTATLGATLGAASADAPSPVVGASELVAGRSYTDWEIAWTRWVAAQPASGSSGDARCITANQRGPVWFLSPEGRADDHVITARCSIPASSYLMLGVPAVECTDVYRVPGFPSTARGLRRCARKYWRRYGDPRPRIVLDGTPLTPGGVRVAPPAFSVRMPADDNIFGAPGQTRATVALVAAPLLLRPLSPGPHKLVDAVRYRGTFDRVVIYRLTVG